MSIIVFYEIDLVESSYVMSDQGDIERFQSVNCIIRQLIIDASTREYSQDAVCN